MSLGLGLDLTKGVATSLLPSRFSLSLDGVGDYVSFTETAFGIDDAGDDGSISFWAKRTDNSDEATVLGHSGTVNSKRLWFDSDGDRLDIEGEQASQQAYAAVTADTDWHHYVITWVGQDGGNIATTIMYEDGGALSTTQVNFGATNDKDFVINQIGSGGDPTVNTNEFKGLLYQIAIWDVALDALAVAAIYNSGTPIGLKANHGNYDNSEDLVTLWKFAEGSGAVAADSVGNLTGTLAGNATFSSTTP